MPCGDFGGRGGGGWGMCPFCPPSPLGSGTVFPLCSLRTAYLPMLQASLLSKFNKLATRVYVFVYMYNSFNFFVSE